MRPTAEQRLVFYRAAVIGLRALDERENRGRRFGADADARWVQFSGALTVADRLDILLRDASVHWGAAFSPAACFGELSFGLAEDEPFGPDWVAIDDAKAGRLLKEPPGATLGSLAQVFGIVSSTVQVPDLNPATKLVVAGGSGIAAVAAQFAQNTQLSWSNQVAVIADDGAFRQLAGLAAVMLGASARTVLVRPGSGTAAALRSSGFQHVDAAIVSADAEAPSAELARSFGRA